MFAQHQNVNALNRYGFNDGKVYFFHVANEGFGALYQQKAQELNQRLGSQNLIFSSKSYHVSELDRFITQLKQQKITVYLLINPYQQPYLDKLTKYKLDEDFVTWKSEIVQIAAQHQLAVYDFAIASPIVTDVVDANSRTAEHSRYFWEPAHYRPAFGELILNSLMTKNCQHLCKISGN